MSTTGQIPQHQHYRLTLKNIKCMLLLTSIFFNTHIFAAASSLTDAGVLVGATAEAGSADKEGLFDWKDADKVKSVIKQEFGLVQTTAYPAWGVWTGTAQNPKTYDLTSTNKVINWADAEGKKIAIHLLAGSGTYFPAWFNTGTWTNAQIEDLLTNWISSIMTSNNNAAKVDYWNVVNEAFTWDGQYWADPTECRWQQLGWEEDKSGLSGAAKVYDKHPVYIRKAFEIARKYSTAKLELRDYYIEFWDDSKKAQAFYQLVKHLKNSGVPIDAIGFQGHFRLDKSYDWAKLTKAVQEYKKLGLEVYITEIDYGDTDQIAPAKQSNWSTQMEAAQKTGYYNFVKAAVAGGVDWLCLWGVADNTNAYWRMGQDALLFTAQYQPKAVYNDFRKAIVDVKGTVGSIKTSKSQGKKTHMSTKMQNNKLYVQGLANGTGTATFYNLDGTQTGSSNIINGIADINSRANQISIIRLISSSGKCSTWHYIK